MTSPVHYRCHSLQRLARVSTMRKKIRPSPKIGRLILVRHGQSVWNVTDPSRDLTARFTGWADIGLTKQGEDQAVAAGRAIQYAANKGILPSTPDTAHLPKIDVAFCSLLKRAADTMNIILEELHLAEKINRAEFTTNGDDHMYRYKVPLVYSWRLNERHYGSLVGLSKEGAERLFGKVRLTRWRDSWNVPPPPMPLEMVKRWGKENHCQPVTILKRSHNDKENDAINYGDDSIFSSYDGKVTLQQNELKGGRQNELRIMEHGGNRKNKRTLPSGRVFDEPLSDVDVSSMMPASESLRDTYERFLPIWTQGITPYLRAGKTVLLVGHANTIRSILFVVDPEVVRIDNMKKVKIPSALPLVYEFVDKDGGGLLDSTHTNDEANIDIHCENEERKRNNVTFQLNGRKCSDLLPGNVRVLMRPRNLQSEVVNANVNPKKRNFRFDLNGLWVETDETQSVSFCTDVGQIAGEGDIA
mmetsp:Transcript_9041/g.16643  ORF Transcript_9041/g.16643 Transcript_9041/m.16643 type:complete len:472 (-) Transcript_9041:51-1466(-)